MIGNPQVSSSARLPRVLAVAAVISVAPSIAALMPAVAEAKTLNHSGKVIGDKETKVTFKAQTDRGKPSKVLDFTAKGIVSRCDGTPTRFNFTVLVPLRVNDRGNFKARLPDENDAVLRVTGKLKNHGRKSVGNIKSNEFNEAGMTCQTPKQRFKTAS